MFRTLVGLVVLAAAGGITAWLVATTPTVSTTELQAQSIRVQVLEVQPVEVARQWRGHGRTQPLVSAQVNAQVGALVDSIPEGIEEGAVVLAGQIIAELDKTDFLNARNAADSRIAELQSLQTQLESQRENLEERLAIEQQNQALAQAEYQRQVERLAAGSSTESDVDRAGGTLNNTRLAINATRLQLSDLADRGSTLETQIAAAQSDRGTAQANLNRATVRSPIAGIIVMMDLEEGENLAPNTPVAYIINPQHIELPLQLPASARPYVQTGNAVTLTTRSQPDDCPPWSATVERIGAENQATRTFTVYAEIDQTNIDIADFAEGGNPHQLPVGAFTLARLDTAEPQQRFIIPARAVQEGRIRTVVDGAVVSRPVVELFTVEGTFDQFGLPDTEWVVLADVDGRPPFEPGERVVLNASMTILDGQRVEPVVTNTGIADAPQTASNGGEPDGEQP